jgi:hypothetical protein
MSPCFARNSRIASRSQVIRVGGCRPGNLVTNSFSGALRTSTGWFTTRVFGWIASRKKVASM